jgi:hypothetical protein
MGPTMPIRPATSPYLTASRRAPLAHSLILGAASLVGACRAEDRGLDLRSFHAPSGRLADAVEIDYRVPRTYVVASDGRVLDLRDGDQDWSDESLAARVRSRLRVAATPPRAAP